MIDKIYVSHCEKLHDRMDYIKSSLSHPLLNGKTEIITFTEDDDKKNLKNSTYVKSPMWTQPIKNSEIYVAEQMFFIYENILENKYNHTLILEDDFIFSKDFDIYYDKYFQTLPIDYDCIFMSSCCSLEVPKNYSELYWESETSRCTCAYIVSLNFCEKIIKKRNYFCPIDWHLNFVKKELNLKYYWTKDIIFNQGSETIYKSNIR